MRLRALAFRFFVLSVLLASAAVAQTPAPTVVRWQLGASNSDWQVWKGKTTLMLEQGGFKVSLWLDWDVDEKISYGNLSVANDTDHRVEFVPSQVTLELVEPKHELFPYIPPDKMERWLRKGGVGTQVSRTRGTVWTDGGVASITATTRTHDADEEYRATSRILRENTLMPGKYIIGEVDFNWPKDFYKDANKKWLEVDLRVPLGNYIFEFPYYVGSRRKWKLSVLTGVPPLPEDEESIRKK